MERNDTEYEDRVDSSSSDENNNQIQEQNTDDDQDDDLNGDENLNSVSVEKRANEIVLPGTETNKPYLTKPGRIIRPCDFATKFLETTHFQRSEVNEEKSMYLRPSYFDPEEMVVKLSKGTFYSESYFSNDIVMNKVDSVK